MGKLLVISAAANDAYSLSAKYLLENKLDTVKEGAAKYAQLIGAEELLYFLPEGFSDMGLAPVAFGKASPVMDNAYAVVQQLKGNLPRPMILDDFVAEYEGKEVSVITPEAAYLLINPDTKFITVNKDGKSEVKEVKYGTKLSEVEAAEGAKAVLLGGLKGRFVLPSQLFDFTVGDCILCTSITVFGQDACMVKTLSELMGQTWENTCGKCVLCREGSLQAKTMVEDMPAGKGKITDLDLLKDIAPLIMEGAYCPYGQNWPKTVLSALELFGGEFEDHIKRKSCAADICFKKGAAYIILPDKCTGCMDCIDECDATAIEGKKGFIHMIDQDMCEQCGKCVDSCDEGAIVTVEGKLPKLPKKLTRVGKF